MNAKIESIEPAVVEDYFLAPMAEVWRALTDPDLIVQWWGDETLYRMTRIEHELRVGGPVFYGGKFTGGVQGGREFSATGRTLAVNAPVLLEYTRQYLDGRPIAEETVIRYELDERNGATRLCVIHSGFRCPQDRDAHADGWRRVMNQLDKHFQQMNSPSEPKK
jgi:uncharacterized protein YndB with AHSA1/START domain